MLLLFLAMLPVGLVGIGGMLGGFCGGVAFFVNQGINRSPRTAGVKVAMMLGVTLAAAVVYFALGTLLCVATH